MRSRQKSPGMTPYHQTRIIETTLGNHLVRVANRPALAQWNEVTAAAALLGDIATPRPDWKVLHFGFGAGALSIALARQITPMNLWLVDTNIIAYDLTSLSLKENQLSAHLLREVDLPVEYEGTFDMAVMELPKGRKLAQRWLMQAQKALRLGGILYLAGSNKGGIQSVIKDAEALFGNSSILGYKKGNRVAAFTNRMKQANDVPEWTKEAGVAPGTWHEMDIEIKGFSFHLYDLPGVFSYGKLDSGTDLLLAHIEFPSEGRLLDLGCGNGLVGLVASRHVSWVDMVDANLLAAASTNRNILTLDIQNARSFSGDVTAPINYHSYQMVVTNPPFHTGYGVDYAVAIAFIEEGYQVLAPGGEFWLVSNRFIRYNPLLEDLYKSVTLIAADNRYQILRAIK